MTTADDRVPTVLRTPARNRTLFVLLFWVAAYLLFYGWHYYAFGTFFHDADHEVHQDHDSDDEYTIGPEDLD